MKHSSWQGRLKGGALAALLAANLSGCAGIRHLPAYEVRIPALTAVPYDLECDADDGSVRQCVMLLREDYDAIVRELKAACLALGGSERDCQAD